ncbi:hypothetical protein [Microvirga massiliensis]|uniref:hypothetical protein n=1 Tax=Microvirga massiliensis TaxID=1033741 RepID=UPI00062BBFE9|nr:hypothetical protein [Microvirga massiliensis]
MEEAQAEPAESAQARIPAAQQATDAIREALGLAHEALDRAVYVNGAGVLSDPSATSDDVRAALEQLERVQALLAATTWPTADDYDAEDYDEV